MIRHLGRRSVLGGLAIGTSTLAMGGFIKARAANSPIKIGIISPFSGSDAVQGNPIRIGAEIAANDINANGGVDGRPIQLEFRDDKSNPTFTVSSFRELAGDGVNLYIAGLYTGNALGLIPLMGPANAVNLIPIASGMQFAHETFDRNSFHSGWSSFICYQTYGKLLAQRYPKIKTWAMVVPDAASGVDNYHQAKVAIEKAYSESGEKTEFLDPFVTKFGQLDYKDTLTRILSSPAEGFMSALGGGDIITLYLQGKSFGWTRKLKAICESSLDLGIGTSLGRSVPENAWSPIYWYYQQNSSSAMSKRLYDEYLRRTKDKYPRGLVERGHTLVRAYAAAAKAAKSTETSAIIEALETIKFDTVNGTFRFRKEDHQWLGAVGYVKMDPMNSDPGWGVTEYHALDMASVVEPPSPGKKFEN